MDAVLTGLLSHNSRVPAQVPLQETSLLIPITRPLPLLLPLIKLLVIPQNPSLCLQEVFHDHLLPQPEAAHWAAFLHVFLLNLSLYCH